MFQGFLGHFCHWLYQPQSRERVGFQSVKKLSQENYSFKFILKLNC